MDHGNKLSLWLYIQTPILFTLYVFLKPGIAYSIFYKDRVLKSGGLGVRVKGNGTVPDGNTIFRIGSVSKVFAVSVSYIYT